jgi:hypothetical protein
MNKKISLNNEPISAKKGFSFDQKTSLIKNQSHQI